MNAEARSVQTEPVASSLSNMTPTPSTDHCINTRLEKKEEREHQATLGIDNSRLQATSEIDNSRYSRVSVATFFTVGTLPTDEGLTTTLAGSTVVNYLAASYILLPWAFSQGGTVLGTIILGLVVLQTFVTSSYVLEACARAEALDYILSDEETGHRLPRNYTVKIRNRIFELSLLNKIFLGPHLSRFFTFTTLADLYGITWTFCSVFVSSFHDRYPIASVTTQDKAVYVAIFLAVACPLSCTSILDQVYIQMMFLFARLFMVILMLGTVLVGFANAETSYFGTQDGPHWGVDLFDWSKIVQTTMTCIFATAFQFSVPTLAGASQSKRKLRNVFAVATSFGFFSNIALAILVAVYFGPNQPEGSNLNWALFHGGNPTQDSAWALFVSGYVVLFAAVDGVAVFSLIAVSLGEILMGAVYGESVHEASLQTHMVFRLLGCIPQAIGAIFINDLGVIANYAGIFTILSYTVCPVLLAMTSERKFREKGLPVETHYTSGILSSRICYIIFNMVSFALIAAVVVEGIISNQK